MEPLQQFEKLIKYIHPTASKELKRRAVEQFCTIVRNDPLSFQQLIKILTPLLYDSSWECRAFTAKIIGKVALIVLQRDSNSFNKLNSESYSDELINMNELIFSRYDGWFVLKTYPTLGSGVSFDIKDKVENSLTNDFFSSDIPKQLIDSDLDFETEQLDAPNNLKPRKRTLNSDFDLLRYLEDCFNSAFQEKLKVLLKNGESNTPYLIFSEYLDNYLVEKYVNQLITGIFDSLWVVRQGNIMALTQILINGGHLLCQHSSLSSKLKPFIGYSLIFKAKIFLFSLISCERFCDFSLDFAVSPVAESASYLMCTLSAILKLKHDIMLDLISKFLRQKSDDWILKFNMITLLNYLVMVNDNYMDQTLRNFFSELIYCVDKHHEDICVTVCRLFTKCSDKLINDYRVESNSLVTLLAELLARETDLDLYISPILELFSTLLSKGYSVHPEYFDIILSLDIIKLYESIWKLINNVSSTVRLSCIEALSHLVILKPLDLTFRTELDVPKFFSFLLLYRVLTESNETLLPHLLKCFQQFMSSISPHTFKVLFKWWIEKNCINIFANFNYSTFEFQTGFTYFDSNYNQNNYLGQNALVLNSHEKFIIDINHRIMLSKFFAIFYQKSFLHIENFTIDLPTNFSKFSPLYKYCILFSLLELHTKNNIDFSSPINMIMQELDKELERGSIKSVDESTLKFFLSLNDSYKKVHAFIHPTVDIPVQDQFFSFFEIVANLKISMHSRLLSCTKEHNDLIIPFLKWLDECRLIVLKLNYRLISLYSLFLIKTSKITDKASKIILNLLDSLVLETVPHFVDCIAEFFIILLTPTNLEPISPRLGILRAFTSKLVETSKIKNNIAVCFPVTCKLDDDKELAITEVYGMFSLISLLSVEVSENDELNDPQKIVRKIFCIEQSYNNYRNVFVKLIKTYNTNFKDHLKSFFVSNHIFLQNLPLPDKSYPEDLVLSSLIFHHSLFETLHQLYPYEFISFSLRLTELLSLKSTLIRYMASKCIAQCAFCLDYDNSHKILSSLDCLLDSLVDERRMGGAEAVYAIIFFNQENPFREKNLLKMAIFLFMIVLRHVNDRKKIIRYLLGRCLSQIIYYFPVDITTVDFDDCMIDKQNVSLLKQLLYHDDNSNLDIPFQLNITLRSYQISGINWLNFLRCLNLNGALCDDMGLGKTIQSLIIVAIEHFTNHKSFSLIVCPKILVDHWYNECKKYIPKKILSPVKLVTKKFKNISSNTLNIASYDFVRTHAKDFISHKWAYLIIDEAHLIKNSKSQNFKVLVCLEARHKLILTGTPIQNNVTELWTLFEFLMPGFLGSLTSFNEKYARPIQKSRNPDCLPEQHYCGEKALDMLHKKCLPFILRRMKETVLKDLPPKLIQDFNVELSPIQRKIYNLLADEDNILKSLLSVKDSKNSTLEVNAFLKFNILRKVCNHLSLVPDINSAMFNELLSDPICVNDIENNCKMSGLKQLFTMLGFIPDSELDGLGSHQIPSNKIIIFSQMRKVLSLILNDLIPLFSSALCPLYLDGTLCQRKRTELVETFNSKKQFNLLLSTTSVGSLGLNLSSADTVIFYDHDWNPMKDLQAMDRAHRLGQKKTVNVYRLICKDTLEEKIMNLQLFKCQIANTVVSEENRQLDSSNNFVLSVIDSTSHSSIPMKDENLTFEDTTEEYEKLFNVQNLITAVKRLDESM